MIENGRQNPREHLAGTLLLVMIIASVLAGFGLSDFLWIAGFSALTALVLLWPRTRRAQRIQCAVFVAIGFACLAFAWHEGYNELPIKQMLTQNHLLISLLSAVSFLRLITDARGRGRQIHRKGKKAFLQTIAGIHLFSSVINLSALIIIGDALAKKQKLGRTTATSLQRGFSLAALWSPFFAAMGTCLLYAPGTKLPDLWLLSIPLCLFGLGFTWAEHRFRRSGQLDVFEGYPVNFRALWVPSLMVVCVLTANSLVPKVSVLVLVSALSLIVTALVIAVRESFFRAIATVRNFSYTRLPDMYAELVLFFSTGVMATGISVLVRETQPTLDAVGFTPGIAIALLAVLLVLAVAGVHAIVSIVAASAIVMPLNPEPAVLAFIFLINWSVGATGGPISGLNLAMQSRYGMTMLECFTWNLRYTIGMFIGASAIILVALG
ncbi:MAG TPA: hypothetical protein DHW07_00155 [Gammaproteobacteria bacterium]|nr:hypothetical protein [Gammaproteobacteria bacterium]